MPRGRIVWSRSSLLVLAVVISTLAAAVYFFQSPSAQNFAWELLSSGLLGRAMRPKSSMGGAPALCGNANPMTMLSWMNPVDFNQTTLRSPEALGYDPCQHSVQTTTKSQASSQVFAVAGARCAPLRGWMRAFRHHRAHHPPQPPSSRLRVRCQRPTNPPTHPLEPPPKTREHSVDVGGRIGWNSVW